MYIYIDGVCMMFLNLCIIHIYIYIYTPIYKIYVNFLLLDWVFWHWKIQPSKGCRCPLVVQFVEAPA